MEEVDKILIRSLRLAGTAVPAEVQTLREFSTELIVESVVRCLRVISPSLASGFSPLLPPGMSARFRMGMGLAQACTELGYPRELGYQSFLYSSEPDIRHLLMFLAERLPRDAAEDADQPAGEPAVLRRAIASRIKEQLAMPWVPPACRIPRLQRAQGSLPLDRFHAQRLVLPDADATGVPKEVREFQGGRFLPPAPVQPALRPWRVASLLESHAAELSARQEWEAEWKGPGLASRLSPEEYQRGKRQRLQRRLVEQLRQSWGRVAPSEQGLPGAQDLGELLHSWRAGGPHIPAGKGSRFTHAERFTFRQETEAPVGQAPVTDALLPSKRSEQDVQAAREEEAAALQQQLDQLGRAIEEVGAHMKKLNLSLGQVEAEIRESQLGAAEREQLMRVKKRAVDLLPDAQVNLAKLQLVVENSAQRVINLAGQWEKHRVPLIAEYRQLKKLHDRRELESSRQLLEIKDLHQRICGAADEAKRKEELYKQLVMELENLPKDVSRSAYTQRILEIVGNIRKQKEEITKILADTKELQKEINSLSGKLDRTFAVTDELVFKDAKKDEDVRKAYKYLAALHENCSQLIQTIEDTGTIMREIRDLEEQIETETGKKTLSNLEKILEDYKAIRHENAGLLGRIRET
ncbi:coiled-coil domain-containing protein 22 [Tachyglossus aculeatus]|uniref:coiled-coil domain-containing protein 22 n=1 Tax=Tachyglossus aculeatus TaxID=9261 RepID=UPI0018F47935|nr:coiled-coil domain-containing protein 22 [Tachyglossus aculeatus]